MSEPRRTGEYENGWHPGQTDDPVAIDREIRGQLGDDVEVVFLLDSTGQFDIAFSAWTRGGVRPHYHYGVNIPGYLPMSDDPNYVEDLSAAIGCLVDELERSADAWGFADDDDERAAQMYLRTLEAVDEVRSWDGPGSVHIASDEPHDLGLVFWLEMCHEEECAADAEAWQS